MRAILIQTEPFCYLGITALSIEREVNRHSKARISGYIQTKDKEQYQELLCGSQAPSCCIRARMDTEEEKVLFWGIVTAFTLQSSNEHITLELTLHSASYLMDQGVHLRSFQDTARPCAELYREISQNYPGGGVLVRAKERTAEQFLLQYQETDWEFLRRLASLSGSFLMPADLVEGTKFYVGMSKQEEYSLTETTQIRLVMEENKELKKRESLSYQIRSRELYEMGDLIVLNQIPLYVFRMNSSYEGAELVHRYSLKPARDFETAAVTNKKLAGVSLEGTVSEVKEDQVRIELTEDERSGQEKKIWFPYSTVYSSPDGTGCYFMPEQGDRVRLYLPQDQEAGAYVASAVHLKAGGSRNDPKKKSLKNKYGKEIRITPDMILITNNNGMKIVLKDEEGVLIESDKAICFQAGEEISLSSLQSEVTVVAGESVRLQQGGTGIRIEDDICFQGGKIRMN